MRLKFFLISILLLLSFVNKTPSQAAFGVSSPNIISDKIRPGTVYERTVYLLRSSLEERGRVEITVNAPEIESWISFNRKNQFTLAEDQLNIPIKISIKVPPDADIGNYRGKISMHIFPEEKSESSGLSIATGAEINIDLTLSDEIIKEFSVLDLKINNFSIKKAPFNWPFFRYFFQRLKLDLKIENKGNIKAAPDKLSVDIYDIAENDYFASGEAVKLKKINPFQIALTSVSIPMDLEPGQFWGKVRVYDGEKIIYANNIAFSATYAEEESVPKLALYLFSVSLIVLLVFVFFKFFKIKIFLQKIIKILRISIRVILKNMRSAISSFWRKVFKIADKYKK